MRGCTQGFYRSLIKGEKSKKDLFGGFPQVCIACKDFEEPP